MSWRAGTTSSQRNGLTAPRTRQRIRALLWCIACVAAFIATVTSTDQPLIGNTVFAASMAQGDQPSAGTLAIVGANDAQLYASPGGEVTQQLAAGKVLTAVGRSADNLWVVVHDDANLSGWVEVSEVVLFGIDQLPVMVEGNLPTTQPAATGQPAQSGTPAQTPALLPTPTATPLPTATLTPSPVPTSTPTPLATPSPTPSPTPLAAASTPQVPATGVESLVAIVRGGGADLYDRPGGSVTEQLPTGTALTAWGRSADGAWLVVVAATGSAGWVQSDRVVAFDLDGLPVLDANSGLPNAPGSQNEASSGGDAPAAATSVPSEESAREESNQPPAETPASGGYQITASVALTDARLNIRTGPGTNYPVIAKAGPEESFEVGGRNLDATWVEIVLPDTEEGYGWVAANYVTLSQPLLGVPISPRADVATPQPVDPPAPVATLQQSSQATNASTGLSGRLVFQDTNGGTIYSYDLATGALAKLTSGFDPAISPDGKTVAFTRVGGDHGLFLIGTDGQNERRIWNGGEGLRAPAWSPDGKWIAFVRQSGSFKCRDVGFGICLPDNPFLGSFPETSQPEYNLSRVDPDGQNFRDIPALNTAQTPSWQQDGIVYQAITGLEVTTDTDDAKTKVLVHAPYYQDPTWQPNGNRILFQGREGSHWEIFTINSDGSGQAALTHPATALVEELPSNVAPTWSPDGQWILFLSNRDENNSAGPWRFWVMSADGSNQHPLPIDVPLEYGYTNEQPVSWGISS